MKTSIAWSVLAAVACCVGCGTQGAPGPADSAASAGSQPQGESAASAPASAGAPAAGAATSAAPPGGPAVAEADPFGPPPSPGLGRCEVAGYAPPAGAALELVTRVRGTLLAVGLHNTGSAPICTYSHIATHELQHDWLSVSYLDGGAPVTVRFTDSRDRSAPVSVEIAPGATSWVSFDLAAWKARQVNRGSPLPKGHLDLTVRYDTTRESRVWAGRLEAKASMDVP